jgi:hypothetical protein
VTQSPSEEKRPLIPNWAKKVVPVMVSVGILYYYFHDQNWQEIYIACSRANLWLAVPAVVVPQLVFWFMGTLLVERQFKWFHGPFPFWSYFWVHGAMYILMFINPALGGGGLLLYQQRKANITWRKLLGIILFRTGVGVGWGMMFVMIPATLALHYYGLADKVNINLYIWWFVLIVPGAMFLTSNWFFWFHGIDSTGLGKVLVPDRETEFWTAFHAAEPRHWVLTWLLMVPPIVIMFLGLYLLNRAFGIDAPFVQFMVAVPFVTIIMDLPIAFGGFGTATVAWDAFFSEYGTKEEIYALSIFLPVCRMVCRAVIGVFSLPPALKELNSMSLEPDEKESHAATVDEGEIA